MNDEEQLKVLKDAVVRAAEVQGWHAADNQPSWLSSASLDVRSAWVSMETCANVLKSCLRCEADALEAKLADPVARAERAEAEVKRLRLECDKDDEDIALLKAKVADLEATNDALTAQFKGTGHVLYLHRMAEIAVRAEHAEAEVARIKAAVVEAAKASYGCELGGKLHVAGGCDYCDLTRSMLAAVGAGEEVLA